VKVGAGRRKPKARTGAAGYERREDTVKREQSWEMDRREREWKHRALATGHLATHKFTDSIN